MTTTARHTFRWTALVAVLALSHGAGLAAGQNDQEPHRPIPLSLLLEHAEIDTSLKAAARDDGRIGVAAREVLKVVGPHMKREEALALAPLRLLPRLANHELEAGMADILAVTDRLRAELPALRKEHVAIKRALEQLHTAGWAAGRPEYAFLAQRINRHIELDEQVIYPMALVIGDYLRLALQRPGTD